MKTITIDLFSNDIDKAIKEIYEYSKSIENKMNILRQRLADEIANEASTNFSGAVVDDVINGSVKRAEVTVSVNEIGTISVVVADGKDAVWCEFGAGVYHNGGAGSSPHDKGADLGFLIGTYGDGHGAHEVWGYYDESKNLVLTHGTPATMPMYNAAKAVADRAISIAKEVFA